MGSKDRGIGRYTYNLYNTILNIDKKNSYIFFTNDSFSNVNSLTIGHNQITSIQYLPKQKNFQKNQVVNELTQLLQMKSYNPDLIHLNSPFESATIWEAASNKYPVISRFLSQIDCPLVVTLYDLIPLIFADKYLMNKSKIDFYMQRLDLIKNADLILSISESTRQDAISVLDIEPQKIVNISSAASSNFHLEDSKCSKKTLKKLSINEKFILYPASFDHRKNLERAIESFSKAKQEIGKYKFVIVCDLDTIQKTKLEKMIKMYNVTSDVIITGKISDSELNSLYNSCSLFFFPSIYEGSGLPILEALQCNAPIITSNTSSMAEIITNSEFVFDPYDVNNMTDLIKKSILDTKFNEDLKEFSIKRKQNFSWEQCANMTLIQFNKIRQKYNNTEKKLSIFDNENNILAFISAQLASHNLFDIDDFTLNFLSEQILKLKI